MNHFWQLARAGSMPKSRPGRCRYTPTRIINYHYLYMCKLGATTRSGRRDTIGEQTRKPSSKRRPIRGNTQTRENTEQITEPAYRRRWNENWRNPWGAYHCLACPTHTNNTTGAHCWRRSGERADGLDCGFAFPGLLPRRLRRRSSRRRLAIDIH